MAETKQMLKFYKGGQQPQDVGSIWFNDGLLSVVGTNGLEYFSGVQDASWDPTAKKLIIVKANGTDKVELDFSDVASAQILGKLREDLTALSNTVTGIDGRLETVETVVGDENSGLVKAVDANTTAIATLNGDAETAGSVAKAVADAVAAEKDRAEGVESDLQDAIDDVEATVEAHGEDLETIKGVLGLGEAGDSKTVSDLIDEKIEWAKRRGIYRANYEELEKRLLLCGYTQQEIQDAIRILVKEKKLKCGRDDSNKGWLRDYREIDKTGDQDGLV
jgi:hypothetical protein